MARTAEYSIKGYVYQFLKYLNEILAAEPGTTVTIEGSIEDIDINQTNATTAVQCKYHQQAEKFTLGRIYKPVLLMLEHFSNNTDPTPKVRYLLFCHFPGSIGIENLSKVDIQKILSTTSADLIPIIKRIKSGYDIDLFVTLFKIEFGPSVDALQLLVLSKLNQKGFSAEDVDSIVYPTAFQRIVDIATKDTVANRTVEPISFINSLRDVRRVAFTRWTRELSTRAKILRRIRSELQTSLKFNSRKRYFIIDPASVDNFDDDIIRFITNFSSKYSFKYLHDDPPLFAILGNYDIGSIEARIYDNGLTCANGLVGGTELRATSLFRKPITQRKPEFKMEFQVRLVKRMDLPDIRGHRPNELFLINHQEDEWAHPDINVYKFEVENLAELEYIMHLRSDYV